MMDNNRASGSELNQLVNYIESKYYGSNLYSDIVKLLNNESKIYYLNSHRQQSKIPFHLLKHLVKIENSFHPEFLKVNKYNNNLINVFSQRLLSLDIQQAHWLSNNLINNIKRKCPHNVNMEVLIKDLKSHSIYKNLMEKKNYAKDKKTNRRLNFKFTPAYTNQSTKKQKLSSIISFNMSNTKCYNYNYKHYVALNTYNNLYTMNYTINLTDIEVPNNIINFLSLGPNFAIPHTKLNSNNIIAFLADVENIINEMDTSDNHKNSLRNGINNEISTQLNKKQINRNNIVIQQILKDKKEFDKWMKIYNNEIIISLTDKTKQTIILNKELYISKMMDHLNNLNDYKTVEKNPIEEINKNVKDYINKLLNNKIIEISTYKYLCNNNPYIPRMYGLIKAHKENLPIRPITNGCEAPWYKLSKFLNPTLNNYNNNNAYDIKNSLELKTKLESIKLEPNEIMISLDVVALFPSIPLELFFKLIEKNFESNIKEHSPIKAKLDYINGLKLCLNHSFFAYNNTIYKQLHGIPMGGCLSVNVAGIVMNYIIDEALKTMEIKPKIICKYIDDLILIINKDQVDYTLNKFNAIHPKIKFTLEMETNNTLNYLDVSLIRNGNNKIDFKWFKKEISSNRILNYYSNHPEYTKINTVKNMINRALNISSPCYHSEIKSKITKILQDNLYPKYLTDSLIKGELNNNETVKKENTHEQMNNAQQGTTFSDNPSQLPKPKQTLITKKFFKNQNANTTLVINSNNLEKSKPPTTEMNKKQFKVIPYINPLSHNIKKIFKLYDCDINLAFKPIGKILNTCFSKTKDKVDNAFKKNLIYQINCSNCDKSYIGQTKQFLSKRVQQHKSTATSKTKAQNDKTMLSKHSVTNNHNFDFKNPKILHTVKNYKKRQLVESIYIAKNLNTVVNERKDAGNINLFYSNIIEKI